MSVLRHWMAWEKIRRMRKVDVWYGYIMGFSDNTAMKKTNLLTLFLLACFCMHLWAQDRAELLRRNMYNNPKYVTVIAHRGDWRNHPENSLAAFQSCIDMGADMIELDLQKTKDGVLVLMHDNTLNRCSNGNGKISDLTYAEIQQYHLRSGHGVVTRNKIPTLEEALTLCKGKILINVDKGYDYFKDIYALLEKTGTTNQVVFNLGKSLQTVKEENGDVLEKVIYMPTVSLNSKGAEQAIDEWLTIKPVAIECCISEYTPEVKRLLDKIKKAGCKVCINSLWASLNAGHDDDRAVEENDIQGSWGWILEQGATLIQTDRPAQLMEYLKQSKRHKLKK